MKQLRCPVRGCQTCDGSGNSQFDSVFAVKRHLEGDAHRGTLHLVDFSICQEVGIFACTHPHCPMGSHRFFTLQA